MQIVKHKPTSINEPSHRLAISPPHAQSKQMVNVLCAFKMAVAAVAWNLCRGWVFIFTLEWPKCSAVCILCSTSTIYLWFMFQGGVQAVESGLPDEEPTECRKTSQHAPTLTTPQISHPQLLSPKPERCMLLHLCNKILEETMLNLIFLLQGRGQNRSYS